MTRRLLIDHSRPLYRKTEKVALADIPGDVESGVEVMQEVEQLLACLAAMNPQLRSVVELRGFQGMTGDEIAEHIGCSARTVANRWTFGKAWLAKELIGATNASPRSSGGWLGIVSSIQPISR